MIRAAINLVTLLAIVSYCWQQISPSAAHCTVNGGRYSLFSGCDRFHETH